jgi:MtN3 and saliva related transmembrane protein
MRLTMDWQEILGFIGGALITLGLIPQVWRLYKLKSAREISLTFTWLFLLGAAFWLSYGVVLSLPSVILWNGVSLCLMCAMIYAKIKYGS